MVIAYVLLGQLLEQLWEDFELLLNFLDLFLVDELLNIQVLATLLPFSFF